MVAIQRDIANEGRVVMVGRDIGTVVLRAQAVMRKCAELPERGHRREDVSSTPGIPH